MSDDLISRRTIKSLIEMTRDCWAISPYVSANILSFQHRNNGKI